MYNVKLSRYLDTMEIVIYERCITGHKDDELDSDKKRKNNNVFDGLFNNKTVKDEINLHSLFVSKNRTIQKIYNYARANKWEWFFTFTFNTKLVDSFNYELLSGIMSDWLRYIGDNSKTGQLKYLIVPELHKSGRWHFHGLFSGLDSSVWKLTYSGHNVVKKYVSNGKASYKKTDTMIFNISGFPYGWTTATMVSDTRRVSHYITKYITKELDGMLKGKKRYWASRSCLSGIHDTFFMSDHEIELFLESFGDPEYQKVVDMMYNHVKYFEYDYIQ